MKNLAMRQVNMMWQVLYTIGSKDEVQECLAKKG